MLNLLLEEKPNIKSANIDAVIAALKKMLPNKISVEYTYSLYSNIALLYPLNWLFTKLFWKKYMKQTIENIRNMVVDNEPYLYA